MVLGQYILSGQLNITSEVIFKEVSEKCAELVNEKNADLHTNLFFNTLKKKRKISKSCAIRTA